LLRTVIALFNLEIINPDDKKYSVHKAIDLTTWLCVYHKENYNDVVKLLEGLQSASKGYGIAISDPTWVEMDTKNLKDWQAEVESYGPKKFQIVVFLLSNYIDKLYRGLKQHSLSDIGYRSQVVKPESLSKNLMSVCSKIILQINYKIGGATYKIEYDKFVKVCNV
jgi:hypothetical protein